MKWSSRIPSVIAALFIAAPSAMLMAQPGVDAPIRKVTVYPDRALVTRVADLNLRAGEQTVVIENLPESVLDESFRVSASGVDGLVLLGMSHRLDYHAESPRKRVADLDRQISHMTRYDKQRIADRIDAFGQQKNLLAAVGKSSGEIISDQVAKGTIAVNQWDQAYRFIGAKLIEVNDSIRAAQIQMDSVDAQLSQLQNELTTLRDNSSRATKTVQIDLRLSKAGQVMVALEYTVPGASWAPLYDARLADDTGTVMLSYHAEVTQHTGEDWNNIDLSLSTAMPSQGTDPGGFRPWYFSVRDEVLKYETANQTTDGLLKEVQGVQTDATGQVFLRGGRSGETSYVIDGVPVGDPLGGIGSASGNLALIPGSIMRGTDFVATFTTQRKETIPSGDKAVRTTIGQFDLRNSMQYVSRPRNLEGAYRIASLTNQNDAPLMPGRVAIFVGGDFLGNTVLGSLVIPGEEFKLPFGRDNAIKVERKVVSDKLTRGTDKIKSEAVIRITLTNRSRQGRTIDLEEPLPTSKDSRIKIAVGEVLPRPASQDESGKAAWKFDLKPGDSTTVSIPYRIEYAAGLTVIGQ